MKRHGIALWLLAVPLLFLSAWRPFIPARERTVPDRIAGLQLERVREQSEADVQLLGTNDVIHRDYGPGDRGFQNDVYLIAVFHGVNWKSVHPPDTCLAGTGFEIQGRSMETLETPSGSIQVGRMDCRRLKHDTFLLSLHAYVAPERVMADYWDFVFHNVGYALIRSSRPGCLLRVETEFRDDGSGAGWRAAEDRCRRFFVEVLPSIQASIR